MRRMSRRILGKYRARRQNLLVDIGGVEAFLSPSELLVVDSVMGPQRLELYLGRRDTAIVCPRCQTGCSRVLEIWSRRIGALPILERSVLL